MILSAFQFGSLAMLGWLTAALLPWLIHRLTRQRHQTTSWAAVDLLLVAMKQRARRVYFQQWLLLAVRTLIIAFVAIAVAEPMWRSWGFGVGGVGGDAHGHLILVIDQSYSMSCQEADDSRFERAKKQARHLLNQNNGEITSVIGWSQNAQNILGQPTEETSQARAAIDGLLQGHSNATLPKAMLAVSAAIDRAEQEWPQIDRHHIVFISDLTDATWAAEEIESSGVDALAQRASLTVVDVGDEERSNLAIVDLSVDAEVILRNQEIVFTATLRQFGSQSWGNVSVEIKVDGQVVATEIVSVATGEQRTMSFPYQFAEEGRHTVQVSLAGIDDALPIDDRRWLVVNVQPQLRIACIEGFPKAAADVARALVPHRPSAEFDSKLDVEIFSDSRLMDLDLAKYDAVLLCSIQQLTPDEQTRLANYLLSGGGLAVLAGEQTQIVGELEELLPVQIGPVVTSGDFRFDPLEYVHTIVNSFRGQTTSSLLQVVIAKYRQLTARESAEIVLALDTGDPALIVGEAEAGRVAVLAIPASLATQSFEGSPWSSFPVSPSFLPTVRELVEYLAGDALLKQQNILVNQSAVCAWDPSRRPVPIDVRGPDDHHLALPIPGAEDKGQVVFTNTPLSGIYTLIADGEEFGRVAVNLDTRESDLSTVELDSLPKQWNANTVESEQTASLARGGYPFARGLLMVAVILMLFESALACWQGRAWR